MQTKKQLGWKRLLPKMQEIVQNRAKRYSNKIAANVFLGFDYGKVDEVQDLTVETSGFAVLRC